MLGLFGSYHARGPDQTQEGISSPFEELRELIHVIDATQLYYTPDLYNHDAANPRTPLDSDYTYLLFCTQMFAVISNLAALYT